MHTLIICTFFKFKICCCCCFLHCGWSRKWIELVAWMTVVGKSIKCRSNWCVFYASATDIYSRLCSTTVYPTFVYSTFVYSTHLCILLLYILLLCILHTCVFFVYSTSRQQTYTTVYLLCTHCTVECKHFSVFCLFGCGKPQSVWATMFKFKCSLTFVSYEGICSFTVFKWFVIFCILILRRSVDLQFFIFFAVFVYSIEVCVPTLWRVCRLTLIGEYFDPPRSRLGISICPGDGRTNPAMWSFEKVNLNSTRKLVIKTFRYSQKNCPDVHDWLLNYLLLKSQC